MAVPQAPQVDALPPGFSGLNLAPAQAPVPSIGQIIQQLAAAPQAGLVGALAGASPQQALAAPPTAGTPSLGGLVNPIVPTPQVGINDPMTTRTALPGGPLAPQASRTPLPPPGAGVRGPAPGPVAPPPSAPLVPTPPPLGPGVPANAVPLAGGSGVFLVPGQGLVDEHGNPLRTPFEENFGE
jgi:hypothetical protein